MTTRGEINSNFYQIVNVDADGAPTEIKPEFIPNVANANIANYANYANISNIANVANLVSVANVSGIGNIATINLTGDGSKVLVGNGTWQSQPPAANANYANFAGTAYNVSVGNVSGIGNIATINKDGSNSHVLYGNGVWANIPTISNVANSNFANFAGNAFSVDASNIIGTINLANYATVANSVSGSNVSGAVANANYAPNANHANISDSANAVAVANVIGIGNIATVNLDGNVSNLLAGNGSWIPVPSTANANYANYAGNAFSVNGANVSGYVSNATHSNISDSANSVAVANVTGIGNIATVNLDGNLSNILYGNGTFAAAPSVSNVANANYANFAGTAYSVSGSNVTSAVANSLAANSVLSVITANTLLYPMFTSSNSNGFVATFKSTSISANLGNSSLTANTFVGNLTGLASSATIAASANSVAIANVTGIGNIATTNYDGSASNVLYGNGTFAPVSAANATFAEVANTSVITNSNTSSSTQYVAFVPGTGNRSITVDTDAGGLQYVPSTNTLIVGNATLANGTILMGVNGLVKVNKLQTSSGVLWANANSTSGIVDLVAGATVGVGAGSANLDVSGNFNLTIGKAYLGSNANVKITGGSNGYVLTTDGTGNLSWSTSTSSNANYANYAGNAFSVNVGNIVGIGNIATINIDGNTSNWLRGDGTWANIAAGGGDANFANFAGNVTVSSQPNITSLGTLTSLTVSGLANTANLQLTKYVETVPASANTSTSISPNLASGTIVRYTANANFTFNGFTSPIAGQSGTVIITQDSTGGRTMSSSMSFAGGSKTLSTAPGAIDIITVLYDGSTYYATLSKGFS